MPRLFAAAAAAAAVLLLVACCDDAPPPTQAPLKADHCEPVRADYRRAVDAQKIGSTFGSAGSPAFGTADPNYLRAKYPECF